MKRLKFISIPFKVSSSHGLTEFHGIAKFSPAGIVFEFESKILGLVGGEVKEIRLALDEILDIKFRKGFLKFFSKIQIRSQNYSKLAELPNEGGKVKLGIKREDFELAREAVEQMQEFLNNGGEFQLPNADSHEQLPPVPTSVNELFDTEKLESHNPKTTNKLKKSEENH